MQQQLHASLPNAAAAAASGTAAAVIAAACGAVFTCQGSF